LGFFPIVWTLSNNSTTKVEIMNMTKGVPMPTLAEMGFTIPICDGIIILVVLTLCVAALAYAKRHT
jgi:hypothetical protein